MRSLVLALVAVLLFSFPVQADDLDRRLELARQMQDIRPARAQVEQGIEQYVSKFPEERREAYRQEFEKILNVKALEQISIDAYAEVFTVAELEAMVAYYSQPEALSAEQKIGDYARLVYPQIIRMLDQAAIRVKTSDSP